MIINRLRNDGVPVLKLNENQKKIVSVINEKIKNGSYSLESIDCIICDSKHKDIVGQKDRYGLEYNTNLCKNCGFVYTSPRMNQSAYNSFYDNEYRLLYNSANKKKNDFFYSQYHRAEKIYDTLNREIDLTANKNIIEVGCGAGGILKFFKDKGHNVLGCDLGSEYLDYGKKEWGLNLHNGFLIDIPKPNKVDIIIYSHVLEHILDLKKELEIIKEYINENTLVYIEVPGIKSVLKNFKSDFGNYFQNAHTFHFSLTSLTNLFNNSGFDLVYGDEYIRSIFKLNTNSDKVKIVDDYNSILKNIKTTEAHRKSFGNKFSLFKKSCYLMIIKMLKIVGIKSLIQKNRLNK